MSATKLLADLRSAGLTVVEEPGWRTRGRAWLIDGDEGRRPEGVMQHHTAPPNPYPIKKLYGPPFYRIKCNMATHEDGTLFLVAYGRCNYSSGVGMKAVLEENVRKEIPPTHNARKRGLVSGNRRFWNYENSHPGDGSPLPSIQLETIVVSNIVINNHFGLNWKRIISHAEWTSRKIDPRWNGSNRTAIEQIRELVGEGEDMSDGPNGEPNWDEVSGWAKNSWTWAWANGLLSADKPATPQDEGSHPKAAMTKQELMVHLKRYDAQGPHPT